MTAAGTAWHCRAFPAAVGWRAAPTLHYEPGRLGVPPKSRVTPKRLGSDRGKYDAYPLPNSLYTHLNPRERGVPQERKLDRLSSVNHRERLPMLVREKLQ